MAVSRETLALALGVQESLKEGSPDNAHLVLFSQIDLVILFIPEPVIDQGKGTQSQSHSCWSSGRQLEGPRSIMEEGRKRCKLGQLGLFTAVPRTSGCV